MLLIIILWTSNKTLNLMDANKPYMAKTLCIMDANINGFTVIRLNAVNERCRSTMIGFHATSRLGLDLFAVFHS